MPNAINRRRFDRFLLNPGYTPVAVRTLDEGTFAHKGHSYDISEGGVQFEVDRAIKPGTPVALRITLPIDPRDPDSTTLKGRQVIAYGNIVWLDESEPGPVRMAATFSRFARPGDRERLLGRLSRRLLRRAA